MHFEILVEDQSGKILLENIMEQILGQNFSENSWKVYSYSGIGQTPKNLTAAVDPRKRLLLNQLPRLLRGYGKSLQDNSCVIVVVDLDNKDCTAFKQELLDLHAACNPRPRVLFRIAIEEGEAWLLGDRDAVKTAYPDANDAALYGYVQDSICGTWEILADAVHQSGSGGLDTLGYPEIGKAKCRWAAEIGRHMDIYRNQSKSFQVFRDGLQKLT